MLFLIVFIGIASVVSTTVLNSIVCLYMLLEYVCRKAIIVKNFMTGWTFIFSINYKIFLVLSYVIIFLFSHYVSSRLA